MPYQLIPASVYHNRLKAAFKFDDDDLAFNREGNLSPRQSQVFEKTRINQRNTAVACLIVAGLMGVLLLISAFASTLANYATAMICTMLVGTLMGGIYFFYRSFTSILDTEPGAVASVQGNIELVNVNWLSVLKVGNMEFNIPTVSMAAFQNYEPYSIYYLSQHKKILSVERLFESGTESETTSDGKA